MPRFWTADLVTHFPSTSLGFHTFTSAETYLIARHFFSPSPSSAHVDANKDQNKTMTFFFTERRTLVRCNTLNLKPKARRKNSNTLRVSILCLSMSLKEKECVGRGKREGDKESGAWRGRGGDSHWIDQWQVWERREERADSGARPWRQDSDYIPSHWSMGVPQWRNGPSIKQ